MLATAAVVQMAVNPKMLRISHPMNCLDHWNNLVNYLVKQVQSWDLPPSAIGDLLATIGYLKIRESEGIHFIQTWKS